MYSEQYCNGKKETCLELVRKGIEIAIASDMYVLVDWHILSDSDPNEHINEAIEFFDLISKEYADCPNVIYEICNEPNGDTLWKDIMNYSNKVIPAIRENSKNAVILVGTPEYDKVLGDPVLRRLDYDNLMYVLHFYAASNHHNLRSELATALKWGLPVFISECGLTESDGDGDIDFKSATEWFTYLNDLNMSYCVWNMSDKKETSSFFKVDLHPENGFTDDDLSACGQWVKELIRGRDPEDIPRPADLIDESISNHIRDLIDYINSHHKVFTFQTRL